MTESESPLLIRFLSRILPADLFPVLGDLEEDYNRNAKENGSVKAHLGLWFQVIRAFPILGYEFGLWNLMMFVHYLKTGVRVIRRQIMFTVVNVSGLASGMAVCLLIMLFILDQRSYDHFHHDSEEIFRVTSVYQPDELSNVREYATSPETLADILNNDVAVVASAITLQSGFRGEVEVGDESIPVEGIYAGPDFFQMFDFTLSSGSEQHALRDPGSMLLSPTTADRIFGVGTDPVGSTVRVAGGREYMVTGILQPVKRSHLQFDSIVSFSTLGAVSERDDKVQRWSEGLSNSYTYLRLKKGGSEDLETLLSELIPANYPAEDGRARLEGFRLQHITDINLGRELVNQVTMVMPESVGWFLAAFGIVIMLIAGFNYVSLTIARALSRSREVGVRRVVGATGGSIFSQFVLESVLMAVFALLFALLLLQWMLPYFNDLFLITLSKNQITLNLTSDFWVLGVFLLFSLTIGLLAGVYPAKMFAKHHPLDAFNDRNPGWGPSRRTLKNVLSVSQLALAFVFIVTGLAMTRQLAYMTEINYGFDDAGVVNVALQDVPFERFKLEAESIPGLRIIAPSSKIPALGSISGVSLQSDLIEQAVVAHDFSVDSNYIDAMGLQLIAGSNFGESSVSSVGAGIDNSVIISRSSAATMGFSSPEAALGAVLRVEGAPLQVVGVIEDFISNNPTQMGDPIVLRVVPSEFRYAVIKVDDGYMGPALLALNESWAALNSSQKLRYQVFSEQLQDNPIVVIFRDLMRVFGLLAAFSLLISCLGLYGMAAYSTRNRFKEIGVRKVLGASRRNLVFELSKSYMWMVAIAMIVGGPVGWLLNSFWLSQLSNSVAFSPITVIYGALAISTIALGTVATQTFRAANRNVVSNLRTE